MMRSFWILFVFLGIFLGAGDSAPSCAKFINIGEGHSDLIKIELSENKQGQTVPITQMLNRLIYCIGPEIQVDGRYFDYSYSNYSLDEISGLMLAADEGMNDLVTTLLDYYAVIDLPSMKGMTALHYAAQKDHIDVVDRN